MPSPPRAMALPPAQHAADKSAAARQASAATRGAVNEKQFNVSQLAAKKKAEGQADSEMERFFADQEVLQDEARCACRRPLQTTPAQPRATDAC